MHDPQSSHFTKNAGTQDYVYGQTDAKSLAKSNPNEAIMNADNHEVCYAFVFCRKCIRIYSSAHPQYFAENNPLLA